MLDCMEENPLQDIRAKDVFERAALNKTTFYKYYKDVGEIVTELEQEQLEKFGQLFKNADGTDEALLRKTLHSLDRAGKLYHAGSGGGFTEHFRNGLIETAKKYGLKAWQEKMPQLEARKAELVYEGLAAGALRIIQSAGGEADREVLIDTIMSMFNSYVRENSGTDRADTARE